MFVWIDNERFYDRLYGKLWEIGFAEHISEKPNRRLEKKLQGCFIELALYFLGRSSSKKVKSTWVGRSGRAGGEIFIVFPIIMIWYSLRTH